ncbi:uncharacterized protein LOC131956633 [Physella acuta]|uniref:uncharacterized protein LOC131956633 n=1 Tax=Physella acuta TaxID=109671 RepID=UPI0027DB73FC|nr:uncharacterized protein LOC131956633 [Physella acuta]
MPAPPTSRPLAPRPGMTGKPLHMSGKVERIWLTAYELIAECQPMSNISCPIEGLATTDLAAICRDFKKLTECLCIRCHETDNMVSKIDVASEQCSAGLCLSMLTPWLILMLICVLRWLI